MKEELAKKGVSDDLGICFSKQPTPAVTKMGKYACGFSNAECRSKPGQLKS